MSEGEPDRVTNELWVGPHPRTEADVERLAEAGITAVLGLQTDDDLAEVGLDLRWLRARLGARGIRLHRVPIRDFDEKDLTRRLPAALARLEALADAGHRTYVHCTAGVGRSAAAALACLARRGATLSEAQTWLARCRPSATPNTRAVARALGLQTPTSRERR
jgi:protein-tyrosine phosphatase